MKRKIWRFIGCGRTLRPRHKWQVCRIDTSLRPARFIGRKCLRCNVYENDYSEKVADD